MIRLGRQGTVYLNQPDNDCGIYSNLLKSSPKEVRNFLKFSNPPSHSTEGDAGSPFIDSSAYFFFIGRLYCWLSPRCYWFDPKRFPSSLDHTSHIRCHIHPPYNDAYHSSRRASWIRATFFEIENYMWIHDCRFLDTFCVCCCNSDCAESNERVSEVQDARRDMAYGVLCSPCVRRGRTFLDSCNIQSKGKKKDNICSEMEAFEHGPFLEYQPVNPNMDCCFSGLLCVFLYISFTDYLRPTFLSSLCMCIISLRNLFCIIIRSFVYH
ncbi:hypothetical protein DFH05DRAFT_590460 [Lentinula detonsa]|uniref:Uncharacterized protein n=1 Tax=Lentinula detonsa TaxID=2804962 RepID=A0A9W8U143_9AGAR|nr:hypothetical protein DFH05DRAFT_590460 [Lentinula detonsa]